MAADINPEDLQGGAHPGGSPDDRFERSDARASGIIAVTLILFAVALLTAAAVYYYWTFLERAKGETDKGRRTPVTEIHPTVAFQGTQSLQISPKLDMDLYRLEMKKRLEGYGWVSAPEAKVVHIPVHLAMEMILKKGLPTRPAAAALAFGDQGTSAPQDSSSGRTYRNSLR